MSNISDYWYKRMGVPQAERERIKSLVVGEQCAEFELENETKKLIQVDGECFKSVFIENRKYLYKGDYTAPPYENDYSYASNYLSEDGLAGFSITHDGWLVSLFSNYDKRGFSKSIKKFVIGKAYKLVCIVANTDEGNALVELYQRLYGFRKYVSTINDIDVMRIHYGDEFIDNFIMRNGTPFHVFMIGKNAVGIGEDEHKRFEDYFEAEKYVDDTVKNI